MTEQALKEVFHQEMITLCKRRTKEIKYKSSRLLDLINKYGGYEAAIKHVITDMNIFEFTLLWEQERLDLSIEALVTKQNYKDLFPQTVYEFCELRLKEYNYAPKKLAKVEEEIIEDWKETNTLFEDEKMLELQQNTTLKAKQDLYPEGDLITLEQWKEIFMDEKIFSEKNKDMIVRIYLMGGKYIEVAALSKEEGYSAVYPYEGVITALCKRLKNALKIETPISKEGKMVGWPIVFTGFFNNNKDFCISLRKRFREALQSLIEEGKLDLTGITVQTHKIYEDDDAEEEEKNIKSRLEEITARQEKERKQAEAQKLALQKVQEGVETAPHHTPKVMDVEALMARMFDDEPASTIENKTKPEVEEQVKEEVVPEVEEQEQVKEKVVSVVAQEKSEQIESQDNVLRWNDLKEACLDYYGAICEICGFDYGYVYGDAFEKMIPIHNLKGTDETVEIVGLDPHKDLVPVCHNCHAVLHSQNPPYTIEDLKAKLQNEKKRN